MVASQGKAKASRLGSSQRIGRVMQIFTWLGVLAMDLALAFHLDQILTG